MTTERKPHKYAEVIKAWADGKPIPVRFKNSTLWIDEDLDGSVPLFNSPDRVWRIKPKCVETYHLVRFRGEDRVEIYTSENLESNLRLIFEDKNS